MGLAAADLDGDGALDIVLSALNEPPPLFMNACSAGHWIELSLDGPGRNRQGFGARVEVEAGGRRWIREIHSLRAVGQGPARVHVGVGALETIDGVRVLWPGGAWTEVPGPIAADRHYRVAFEPR